MDFISCCLSIANVIIGLVISIVGLRIELLQRKDENRKKNEEKKQEKMFNELTEKVGCIDSTIKDAEAYFKAMNNLISNDKDSTENMIVAFNKSQDFAVGYKKCREIIKPLYESMVINESMFSLSYGFGRYIDAFRDFIFDEGYEQQLVQNIIQMSEFEDLDSNKNSQKKYLDFFKHNCELLNKMACKLKEIQILVHEMGLKFPDKKKEKKA